MGNLDRIKEVKALYVFTVSLVELMFAVFSPFSCVD